MLHRRDEGKVHLRIFGSLIFYSESSHIRNYYWIPRIKIKTLHCPNLKRTVNLVDKFSRLGLTLNLNNFIFSCFLSGNSWRSIRKNSPQLGFEPNASNFLPTTFNSFQIHILRKLLHRFDYHHRKPPPLKRFIDISRKKKNKGPDDVYVSLYINRAARLSRGCWTRKA